MKDYKKEGKIKGSLKIEGNLILTGDLEVEQEIEVAGYIDCKGYSIESEGSIKAGYSIEAGYSILSQLWIKCKTTLSAGIYIYAGIKTWGERTEEDMLIECGKLESGKVEFGNLVETGIEKPEEMIELDGKKYSKSTLKEALKAYV